MTRLLALVLCLLTFQSVFACDFKNDVPVTMISNAFEAWSVVTDAMSKCGNFKAEQDAQFKEKEAPGMATNPATYTIGGVANSSILPLLNDGLIRPLNDLVEQHGQQLAPTQLVEIDGNIMAIAMMVNSQHFMYRKDIFDELGIAVPKTYDDVLKAAQKIEDAGVVDQPYGAAFKPGVDLGLEFLNIYLGLGGELVNPDNTSALDAAKVSKTLEILKALSGYMDPEYLSSDSPFVSKQLKEGKIAMAFLWASDAADFNNPEESQVVDKIGLAAAPAALEGGPAATTLWWDGMTIAKNVTDETAEAAFKLMMAGLSYDNLAAHPDAAIWLSEPTIESTVGAGVLASVEAGAPSFPSTNQAGLMAFTAFGENVGNYLQGKRTAAETFSDIEASYTAAAKEAGYIK